MMVPYNKMFKNKLKFATTAPNSILYSNLIYGIRSVWDNQIQAKITNFFIQINDESTLGKIMEIRLLDIQRKLWLPFSPLSSLPFERQEIKKIFKNNFILENLLLMKQNNIDIKIQKNNISKNNNIIGGKLSILEVVGSEIYIDNIKLLRRYNLLFFNQLTTISGQHFLSFWQLLQRRFMNPSINKPSYLPIYEQIKNIVTYENSYKLKPQYIEIPQKFNLKGYEFIHVTDSYEKHVMFWNNNNVGIGKIVQLQRNIFTVRHLDILSDSEDSDLSVQQ
jgi:hypothetical protein